MKPHLLLASEQGILHFIPTQVKKNLTT